MKDMVRVGIVGSKFAADFHCDSYSRNPFAKVVAVAAIDNLEQISKKWNIPDTYLDYNEMLARKDIDLVSVCVPNFLHHKVVLAAAKAGKDILCEKPLATEIEHGREMLDAVKKAGVKLFYGEDWVFSPSLRRVEAVLAEKAVGDILYVRAKECHNGTHSPFAKKKETCGGGSLMHLGIHPIGWILHLLGQEGKNKVVEVTGFCNNGAADNYIHKDNTGEDFGMGVMKFAGGQRAVVEGNYITLGGMDDKIEIYGTDGIIKVDLTHSSNVDVYSKPGYSYWIEKADHALGWTRPAVDEFHGLGYVDDLRYAVDCVRNNVQPKYGCSGELGFACLEIIKAMYRSSETGQTIKGVWG